MLLFAASRTDIGRRKKSTFQVAEEPPEEPAWAENPQDGVRTAAAPRQESFRAQTARHVRGALVTSGVSTIVCLPS